MEDENFYKKQIGTKVKLARIKAGYTQEKLAEKLSLSTRYISQLERGVSFGTASTIIRICKELNIDANFLFGDIIAPSKPINIFDSTFSKNYIKLNDKNKELLNLIAADLLKFQQNSKK